MKKQLIMSLCLTAVVVAYGCNKELIENIQAPYISDEEICKCDTECGPGIVCNGDHDTPKCQATVYNFIDLCKISMGTIYSDAEGNNFCKCNETVCSTGIICGGNGEYCANDSIPHGPCKPEETKCIDLPDRSVEAWCEVKPNSETGYEWSSRNCNKNISCMYISANENEDIKEKASCGECKNNSTKCDILTDTDETKYQFLCKEGLWEQQQKCDNGCTDDHLTCKACDDNTYQCEGNVRSACIKGEWVPLEICDLGCVEKPKQYQDGKSEKDYQYCNECSENDNKCQNDKKYTCKDGKWENGIDCENNASCNLEGKCGECKTGSTKCDAGEMSVCINGEFIYAQTCKSNCYNDICADCVDGALLCQNNEENIGVLKNCQNGIWTPKNETDNETGQCKKGNDLVSCGSLEIKQIPGSSEIYYTSDCGVCKNGATKCENGKIQLCQNGEWVMTEICETGTCITDGTGTFICGECNPADENNNIKCENKTKYKCSEDNIWIIDEECNFSCTDKECGDCNNDEARCENGFSIVCVNGKEIKNKCSTGECNDETNSCDECEDGNSRCTGGVRSVCIHNNWTPIQICDLGCIKEDIASDNKCKECDENDTKCESNQSFICENGLWKFNNICKGSCKSDKECGDCINGDTRCINNSEGIGQYQTCVSGEWSAENSCAENASCQNSKECGECANNDNQCLINQIRTCTSGKWSAFIPCENASCKDDNKSCGECNNNDNRCNPDINSVQQCVNGIWELKENCNNNNTICINNECKNIVL